MPARHRHRRGPPATAAARPALPGYPDEGAMPSALEGGSRPPPLIADRYRLHETVPIRNDPNARRVSDKEYISPLE